ncbi:MAG: NACHT domain-containing protein [Polyangiaceae bacterium]|nr:NACHT domain-containing protein [Polyangiaceae bacterium]
MKTFLAYGADAREHADLAKRVAVDLQTAGIWTEVDLLGTAPLEGWRVWNDERLVAADVVLVLATAPFAKRIEVAEEKNAGRYDAKLALRALREKKRVVLVVPDDPELHPAPGFLEGRVHFTFPTQMPELTAHLQELAGDLPGGEATDGAPLVTMPAAGARRPTPDTPSTTRARRSPTPRSSAGKKSTGTTKTSSPRVDTSNVVRRYLEKVCESYEKAELDKMFVRPSGESAGRVIVDLVGHTKSLLETDRRARVLLLGDYGTGKSWFAQRLTYELAKSALAGELDAPLPVFLSLSFARGKPSLAKAIAMFLARVDVRVSEQDLIAFLKNSPKVVLILDGLDELGERIKRDAAPKFVTALNELSAATGVRSVITCRTTFFKDSVDEDQVAATEKLNLRVFDDRQIDEYLHRMPKSVREPMVDVLDKTPRLRELCRTPIHMLLAREHVAERAELGADFRLIDLYDTFVKKNLAAHATTNPGWSQKARRDFVRSIAYQMFDEGLFEMSTEALEKLLATELPAAPDAERAQASTQIVNASFFVRAGGAFRPLHFSFLEYFAAETLVEDLYQGKVDRWNRRPLYAEVFDFMIQMIQRRGVDKLPVDAIVQSEREEAPSNFLATMYRWPVPEVRPYFEKLLLNGKWPLVRAVACQGAGLYDGDRVIPSLLSAFDNEPNTVIRATLQRLLDRVRPSVTESELLSGINDRTKIPVNLVADHAEEILRTKQNGFALTAYRKALMLGDKRPSSTIAAIYLLAGVADSESYSSIQTIAQNSQLPVVRFAYEHASTIAPLPPIQQVESPS